MQLWVWVHQRRDGLKWVKEGLGLCMWLLLTDQCLQVRLLSGTFIIRSSSSLESMENTNIYLGPN